MRLLQFAFHHFLSICRYMELIILQEEKDSMLLINKTPLAWAGDICSLLYCQREDSDGYRPGIQKILCELLRIQITRSVNSSEGAPQWRMPIEMRHKNGREIKRRMSSAVQSTSTSTSTGDPTPPPPSASRFTNIFYNNTSARTSPSLFLITTFKIAADCCWVSPTKRHKRLAQTQMLFNLLSERRKVCAFQYNARFQVPFVHAGL